MSTGVKRHYQNTRNSNRSYIPWHCVHFPRLCWKLFPFSATVWSTVDNNYTMWRQVGKQLFCKIHFTVVAIHFIMCVNNIFNTKFCVQHKSIFNAGMYYCKTWTTICTVFSPAESHATKVCLGDCLIFSNLLNCDLCIHYDSSVNTIFQFSLIFVFNPPQVFVTPTDNGNPSYWYSFISLSFTTKCISFKVIWRVLLLKWGWLLRISVCGCQYRVQHWQSISKEEFTNLPYSASIKIAEFWMSAVSSHVTPIMLFACSHK